MGDSATRERLLDAAWHELAQHGVEPLTLAKVAARARVTRQAVYLHFGSRSSLLVAMARRFDHTSGFRRRLAVARAAPPGQAFRRVLAEWFAYLPQILPVQRSLEAAALVGGVGAGAYRDRMKEWRRALGLDIARLSEAGLVNPTWDVDRAADWTWAQVHPTMYDHLVHGCGWTPRATERAIVASIEQMLLTRNAVARPTKRKAGRSRRPRRVAR